MIESLENGLSVVRFPGERARHEEIAEAIASGAETIEAVDVIERRLFRFIFFLRDMNIATVLYSVVYEYSQMSPPGGDINNNEIVLRIDSDVAIGSAVADLVATSLPMLNEEERHKISSTVLSSWQRTSSHLSH